MNVTNGEVIKNGEKELIDAITGDLDWGAIEKIFREKHQFGIEEDVEYKHGDIVVHDGQIAYKFEFEVKVALSILLDREGNYLAVTSSSNPRIEQDERQGTQPKDREEASASEDVDGSAEVLEDVMAERDPYEDTERDTMGQGEQTHEGSEDRITRAASQAADMIAQMDSVA